MDMRDIFPLHLLRLLASTVLLSLIVLAGMYVMTPAEVLPMPAWVALTVVGGAPMLVFLVYWLIRGAYLLKSQKNN